MAPSPLRGVFPLIAYIASLTGPSFASPLIATSPASAGPQTNTTIYAFLPSQSLKTATNVPIALSKPPRDSPSSSFSYSSSVAASQTSAQSKPAKATGITTSSSEYTIQVKTEQATDCNEFPDPGYGGSDAPNYKYWPISTVLDVSCYLDVAIDAKNYTWLRTKDPRTGDACWVDEMNIIEPQTAMAKNGSMITAASLPTPPAPTPKSAPPNLGELDGFEGEDAEDPDEEESEDPHDRKKSGIELSELLPQCSRPRPYQIWTTRNDYLLSKDGFWMSCYAKPETKSKKYEVQWGARHVWCYRDGEEVGGKKRWWRDAHVLGSAVRGSNPSEGFMGLVSKLMRVHKKEEHCWIPEDSFDDMVFSIPGAGGKCRD